LGVQLIIFTVIETLTFQKQTEKLWTASERHALIDWIANTPNAGTVNPGEMVPAKFAGRCKAKANEAAFA
jgi:hypothetical protein